MPKYKIADVIFSTNHIYAYTPKLCKNYLYTGDEPSELDITICQEDIDGEKRFSGVECFPDAYLESLALFRKLCNYTLENKSGIIFHSSAVMIDGKAYLYTAPSGTGKSTHTRLLKEVYGNKVVYINDDKPIIRYVDGKFFVYGTPWNGKHHLDTNIRAPIEAICALTRGEKNSIEKISKKDMLMVLFNQTLRPDDIDQMDKLLALLDKLLNSVKLYRLKCNMEKEAAILSYTTMSKGE